MGRKIKPRCDCKRNKLVTILNAKGNIYGCILEKEIEKPKIKQFRWHDE